MANLLPALVQASQYQQEAARQGAQDIRKFFDRKRLADLGQKFFQHGDFSPQGLQKFAQENELSLPEMQALVKVVSEFQKYQKGAQPSFQFGQTMTPEGEAYNVAFNKANPLEQLILGVKSYPKGHPTETVDAEKGVIKSALQNLYTGDVTSTDNVKRIPTIVGKGITDTGVPVEQIRNKLTGKGIGAPVATGLPLQGDENDPAIIKESKYILENWLRNDPANKGKSDAELAKMAYEIAKSKKDMSKDQFKRDLMLKLISAQARAGLLEDKDIVNAQKLAEKITDKLYPKQNKPPLESFYK